MGRADDLLLAALRSLPQKPPQHATAPEKKRYSERMSEVTALAIAEELRLRGLKGTRPSGPGDVGASGAERRLAGGIGAKKVDVSWTTEESGLLVGVSVKSINFRDGRTNNFQKNLTNRRSDLLMEAVTLHRRFPYAVLIAIFFLDKDAANDGTERRNSTFENAFPRLRLFTGRQDPAGRDEQFERFYLCLTDANKFQPSFQCFEVNDAGKQIEVSAALDEMMELVVERNFDFYEIDGGKLRRVPGS